MVVLSFKSDNNDPIRDSFNEYYMRFEEINNYNALIDNNLFFDHPVKKMEVNEKLIEM